MDKDLKKHLLKIIIQKVMYEENEVYFKRSVILYIENIEGFFNFKTEMKMHLLDTEIYAYE